MSKTYQIKTIIGQAKAQTDTVSADPAKTPTTIKAVKGARYELMDTQQGSAPDNIRVLRSGKNLKIILAGSKDANLVIEDFYEFNTDTGYALVGLSGQGDTYEYLPDNASSASTVGRLKDNTQAVGMALGSTPMPAESFAAAGLLPLAAAAGSNPLLIGAGVLGAAAAAGGGGGGGGGGGKEGSPSNQTVVTSTAMGKSTTGPADAAATNDTTPTIVGQTNPNADVAVTIQGNTYTSKADANGNFRIQIPDDQALPQGRYVPKVVATLNGVKSEEFLGTPFVIDLSPNDNIDSAGKPISDPNKTALLSIDSISNDTGKSGDFVTSDNSLRFTGKASNYTDNGDWVKVTLTQPDGGVVASDYIKATAANGWTWDRSAIAPPLPDGLYVLTAVVVDAAGNSVNQAQTKSVVVDTDPAKNVNTDGSLSADANATNSAKALINSISVDSGTSASDFITNDNTLIFKGSVEKFTNNGDFVWVQLKDSAGKVIQSDYLTPNASLWSWDTSASPLPDGSYTLEASIADPSGTLISTSEPTSQLVRIDTSASTTSGGANSGGSVNPNAKLQLAITGMTPDTNVASDWIGLAKKPTFNGNFGNQKSWTDNGDVFSFQVFDSAGQLKASANKSVIAADNSSWTAPLTSDLADGIYVARSTVTDVAGNLLSSDQQAFQVDSAKPNIDIVKFSATGTGVLSKLELAFTEYVTYTITAGSNIFNGSSDSQAPKPTYNGTFAAGDFSIAITDLAGNVSTFKNESSWTLNALQLTTNTLPSKPNLDLLGNIGGFTLGADQALDLTSLINDLTTAPNTAPTVARNHFDMTGSSAQSLLLNLNDVLSLGVSNSFFKDDLVQIRITGGSNDRVVIEDKSAWFVPTTVTVGGTDYQVYKTGQAEIFVQQGILIA